MTKNDAGVVFPSSLDHQLQRAGAPQRQQNPLQRTLRQARQKGGIEAPPDDGRFDEDVAVFAIEARDALRKNLADGGRQSRRLGALGNRRREQFLGKQRIAVRELANRVQIVVRQALGAQRRAHERLHLRRGERFDVERVHPGPAPQFRDHRREAGRLGDVRTAHHEQQNVAFADPASVIFEELGRRNVGPMRIFDHEQGRPARSAASQHLGNRGVLRTRTLRLGRRLADFEFRNQSREHAPDIAGQRQDRFVGGVERAHDIGQRAERRTRVLEAEALGVVHGVLRQPNRFVDQPRFADARFAVDEHQRTAAQACVGTAFAQELQLVNSADEALATDLLDHR